MAGIRAGQVRKEKPVRLSVQRVFLFDTFKKRPYDRVAPWKGGNMDEPDNFDLGDEGYFLRDWLEGKAFATRISRIIMIRLLAYCEMTIPQMAKAMMLPPEIIGKIMEGKAKLAPESVQNLAQVIKVPCSVILFNATIRGRNYSPEGNEARDAIRRLLEVVYPEHM